MVSEQTRSVENLAYLTAENIARDSENTIVTEAIFKIKGSASTTKIAEEISSAFGVDVTQGIVNEILQRLLSAGKVYSDGSNYTLTEETKLVISQAKARYNQLEQQAIAEWLKICDVEDNARDVLTKAAIHFIRTVFVRHGTSSFSFLTEQFDSATFSIDEIAKEEASKQAAIDQGWLESALLKMFSLPMSTERQDYLIENIHRAISYRSVVVEPSTLSAIIAKVKDLIVYLDTNVLYRILNLQGEVRYQSTLGVLKELQSCGVVFKVCPVTYNELVYRLDADAQYIRTHDHKAYLSEVAYRFRTAENYVSTFWKKHWETGISAEDFNACYQSSKAIIEGLGIEIEEASEQELEQYGDVGKIILEKIFSHDERDKPYNAAWNDARVIAYVLHRQDVTATNAVETKCLFMTTDRGLFALQRHDHDFNRKPPVVVLPSQLLQIISFIKPSGEYFKTFIELFSSAASYRTSGYDNNDIQDIIGRLNHYSGIDAAVASKILGNQLFMRKFASTSDEGEREEIVYEEATGILKKQIEEKEDELRRAQSELVDKTTELILSDDENFTLTERNQKLQAEVEQLKRDNESNISISRQTIHELKDIATETDDKLMRTEARLNQYENDYVNRKWRAWSGFRRFSLLASTLLFLLILISLFFPIFTPITLKSVVSDPDTLWELWYAFLEFPLVTWFAFSLKVFSPNIKESIKEEYRKEFQSKGK